MGRQLNSDGYVVARTFDGQPVYFRWWLEVGPSLLVHLNLKGSGEHEEVTWRLTIHDAPEVTTDNVVNALHAIMAAYEDVIPDDVKALIDEMEDKIIEQGY